MLKGVLQFGLTRRPIILLALLVFVGAGLFAFSNLNIEAYPNPAPVILEITAQANGLSAEDGKCEPIVAGEEVVQVRRAIPPDAQDEERRLDCRAADLLAVGPLFHQASRVANSLT